MKTIFSIIGTRPQIIKSAIIHQEIKKHKNLKHIIIDTGQHYDEVMFKNFIYEYKIKKKEIFFLKCENLDKKKFKSLFRIKIKPLIQKFNPDFVFVYGDTLSTLIATEIMKRKNHLIGHIEAGARSFDKKMLEEKIRKKVDHMSDLLFCCSKNCQKNLLSEGVKKNKIFIVGDILYDLFVSKQKKIKKISHKNYNLLTLHRRENLNSKTRLIKLFDFVKNYSNLSIIFPAHPHTLRKLNEYKIKLDKKIEVINPIGHSKLLSYLKYSKMVFTDSGGVQRESYFLKKKTIVLRDKIEWNYLIKYGKQKLWLSNTKFSKYKKNLLGSGKATNKVIEILKKKVLKS